MRVRSLSTKAPLRTGRGHHGRQRRQDHQQGLRLQAQERKLRHAEEPRLKIMDFKALELLTQIYIFVHVSKKE